MDKKAKAYTVDQIKAKMEHYCAYQDRCHYDVEKKMREFFLIPEARDEILLSLMQDKFLDEERFAKSYARGKFKMNYWGKIKITHGLKSKNISDYLIRVGLKEIDPNEYFSRAEKLITTKIENTSSKNGYDLKSKVIGFMQRKGYEFDIIDEIIRDKINL